MTDYTFDTKPNSYFAGQDLRCERTDTHDVVLLNIKDRMWAVNVKDDLIFSQYPADVQNAANLFPEGIIDGIAERVKNEWWEAADLVAQDHGFTGAFQAGRSGGWCAIGGTEHWGADLIAPDEATSVEERDRFLELAFKLDDLTEAHERFFARVRAAMQELQNELYEYADWVGAQVSSLDGDRMTIGWLGVEQGRPTFRKRKGGSGFCFANEVNLIDKADSALPFSECQGCGRSYPDAKPGHNTGCVIGALLTTLEDRGFDFTGTSIATIDAESWWDGTFGPACDEIENELKGSRP